MCKAYGWQDKRKYYGAPEGANCAKLITMCKACGWKYKRKYYGAPEGAKYGIESGVGK